VTHQRVRKLSRNTRTVWGSKGICRVISKSIPAYPIRTRVLCKLGMCVVVANTMELCSLFLPPWWGVGPMALMLWLELVI
jgi:hypothetical protein